MGRFRAYDGALIGVASIALSVWLLYLAVKVAQHVHAWPF